MSSHREAPEITKDPVADSTDLYAFVSPDRPDTVTIITNYVPLQDPAGGPNFFEFGDDVLYAIHIDNDGDGQPDITYEFQFTTRCATPRRSSTTPARSSRSTAPTGTAASSTRSPASRAGAGTTTTIRRDRGRGGKVLAEHLPCPPCNVGPRSTPNYAALANAAIHDLPAARRCSPGSAPTASTSTSGRSSTSATCGRSRTCTSSRRRRLGVDATKELNVHTIAIQVPIALLTGDGTRRTTR